MASVFGDSTPARGILLSIYFSITVAFMLLFVQRSPRPVATLLLIQIVYKITTPFTVGVLQNPVVISNLAVAALHAVMLVSIFRASGNPFRIDEGMRPSR